MTLATGTQQQRATGVQQQPGNRHTAAGNRPAQQQPGNRHTAAAGGNPGWRLPAASLRIVDSGCKLPAWKTSKNAIAKSASLAWAGLDSGQRARKTRRTWKGNTQRSCGQPVWEQPWPWPMKQDWPKAVRMARKSASKRYSGRLEGEWLKTAGAKPERRCKRPCPVAQSCLNLPYSFPLHRIEADWIASRFGPILRGKTLFSG